MSICCADIPRLPGLESIRFRAGLGGGQRNVRWPYIAENDSISPWVNGGELVFVTGINHQRNEQNLRQLVLEAVQKQVAGLVILVGTEFIQHIPASVLTLANQLEFPILEQPYALPMVRVTEVISNAIVQDNLTGQSVRLFLTKLMNGFAQAPELVHLRAKELGISAEHPLVAVAIRSMLANKSEASDCNQNKHQETAHTRQEALEQSLNKLLKRRGIDWPVLNYEQDLLAIWPVEDSSSQAIHEDIEQALARLQNELPELILYSGLSNLHPGLAQLAEATEQARQALQFAHLQQHQGLFLYEQLGIAQVFAAIPDRRLLEKFCRQHLGELCFTREASLRELKTTLSTWLNHGGHQQHTAQALDIHRNTLSYRLKRIENLLGYKLDAPYQRLNLQNALLIEQIVFQDHDINSQSAALAASAPLTRTAP